MRVAPLPAMFALMIGALMPLPANAASTGPVELRVDNLITPLGIDDPVPRFSWQLQDQTRGAKQTAYRVEVASSEDLLARNKPDVWASGRIDSDQSLNIPYAGPALKPSTRYFWRVELWDSSGKPYAPSQPGWWETGLMSQDAWRAQWIGYEIPEEKTERDAPSIWITSPNARAVAAEKKPEQHFAYRTAISLPKPVRFAALYATGQDTVSAWIDGAQVLEAQPLPPWKQMPWKKFVRTEVTGKLKQGPNVIAIEAVHYVVNPNGMATEDPPPMIATLVVEYRDGTWAGFGTSTDWKVAPHPAGVWQQASFDDSGWKSAVRFEPSFSSDSAPPGHPWIPESVKELQYMFRLDGPVKSARLYVTALGWYTIYLDNKVAEGPGKEQWFAPGWTDYRERVPYQTYDVTDLINQQNRIGGATEIDHELLAALAPGWYSTPLEWFQQPNNYGDTPPALRAQLRIEHNDGRVQWIATDARWQANTTGVLSAELYDGETEDRRLWALADRDSNWRPVQTIQPAPVKIVAQDFPPIRVEAVGRDGMLTPKSMTQPKPGVLVYDFGQNFSGVELLRLNGPPGTKVRARFAEVLNPDGTIYTDNLRTAKATDYCILGAADGRDGCWPHFTFHGFRYMELTGLPTAPARGAVTAYVLHTDAPFTAKLETGSAMINQLLSSILWGQRSNFVGLPTDCPQRDERLGWMADAQVFWRAASYNMDLASFSRKFAADMRGTQAGTPFYGIYAPGTVKPNAGWAAGWSDAGVIIPYTSWLQTGDTSIIEQNWAAMRKYLDAIEAANPDGLWKNQNGTPFGDWLSPEGKTDFTLISTAYWAYDVTLMQRMAHATGRTTDEQRYTQLFAKIRTAFQKQFVHPDAFIAGADNTPSPFGVINNPNAKSRGGDTQTGYVLALHMNLLPENLRAAAVRRLVAKIEENHGMLATGFLGTPYLLEELTKAGYSNLAYHLLLNTGYPSWGYMVEHGATTMWERWNGDQMRNDPSMNSYNHYAYGAVADWIYRYAAGIDATPLDAGFHTVVLHPVFDVRLGHLSFDYDSSYGPIHSEWIVNGSSAAWRLIIPANSTGWLPLSAAQAAKYKLDGVAISQSKLVHPATKNGQGGYELPAGNYQFTVDL